MSFIVNPMSFPMYKTSNGSLAEFIYALVYLLLKIHYRYVNFDLEAADISRHA